MESQFLKVGAWNHLCKIQLKGPTLGIEETKDLHIPLM